MFGKYSSPRSGPVTLTKEIEVPEAFQRLSISLPPAWIYSIKKHGRDVDGGASGVIREALSLWAMEHNVVLHNR